MICSGEMEDLSVEKRIGMRIRLARKLAGFSSQASLAEAIEMTDHQMIGRYERGDVTPPIERLKEIGLVTGRPLYWFFLGPTGVQLRFSPEKYDEFWEKVCDLEYEQFSEVDQFSEADRWRARSREKKKEARLLREGAEVFGQQAEKIEKINKILEQNPDLSERYSREIIKSLGDFEKGFNAITAAFSGLSKVVGADESRHLYATKKDNYDLDRVADNGD